MPNTTTKVLFLDPWNGPTSTRDKNLQVARAKAHAARISHPKRIHTQESSQAHGALSWCIYRPDLTTASTNDLDRSVLPPRSVSALNQQHLSRSNVHNAQTTLSDPPPTKFAFSHLSAKDFRPRTHHVTDWQWINGTRLDPFNCIPGGNEPSAATALEFFMHYLRWKVDIIHGVFEVSNLWGPWLLEYMAPKPHLFFAVVAFMLNTINLLIRRNAHPTKSIVQYKTKALAELRQCLSSPSVMEDDSVIMAISVLSVMEGMGGDMAAYAIHRKKLYALVASRGGIDGLTQDRNVRAFLCQLEPWRTIDISGKVPKCIYPDQPLEASVLTDIHGMPSGFRDLALTRNLSKSTIRVVRNIHGFRMQNNTRTNPAQAAVPVSRPRFDSFADACPALALSDGPLHQPPMEKLLCLALICFRTNSSKFYKFNGAWLHHVLTARLIRYYSRIIAVRDDSSVRNALLWISLITITSSCDEVNTLGPDKQALHMLASLQDKFPEVCGWDTVQYYLSISERFFWNDILTQRLSRLLERLPEVYRGVYATSESSPDSGRRSSTIDSDVVDSPQTWAEQYPAF